MLHVFLPFRASADWQANGVTRIGDWLYLLSIIANGSGQKVMEISSVISIAANHRPGRINPYNKGTIATREVNGKEFSVRA